MVVKTEGQHAGEFIVSEANGTLSREVGTLLANEVLIDGQVLALAAGKLKASDGVTSGEVVVGVVIGAHDATGADKANVPYIARLAELKSALVTAEDVSGAVVDEDALNALNIVLR